MHASWAPCTAATLKIERRRVNAANPLRWPHPCDHEVRSAGSGWPIIEPMYGPETKTARHDAALSVSVAGCVVCAAIILAAWLYAPITKNKE